MPRPTAHSRCHKPDTRLLTARQEENEIRRNLKRLVRRQVFAILLVAIHEGLSLAATSYFRQDTRVEVPLPDAPEYGEEMPVQDGNRHRCATVGNRDL